MLRCGRAEGRPSTARRATLLPPDATSPPSLCLDGTLGADVPFTLGRLSLGGRQLSKQSKARASQPWPMDLHGSADVAYRTRAEEKFLVPRSSTVEEMSWNTELDDAPRA